MPARPGRVALALAVAAAAGGAGLTGCGDKGRVGGAAGRPVAGAGTSTSGPAGSTTTPGPVPSASSPTGPAPTSPAPGATAPAAATPTGGLRLGGDDLGVTRVGAPFRQAVAAVSAVLGRPSGDPPSDTACIGAEEEAAWGPFRLASSGDQVSGWLSTSRTLSTPAGVTVGTTVVGLRRAYGEGLQVRPPPEPDGLAVFVVVATNLSGTLTGQAPADTVASLFNGTCEAS